MSPVIAFAFRVIAISVCAAFIAAGLLLLLKSGDAMGLAGVGPWWKP